MPLNPKKTKNGVDLNEVDVSKMALVDKEGLLDDLGKRLKTEIKGAVAEAVKAAKPEIENIVGSAVNNAQPPSSSGNRGTTQQPPASGGSSGGNNPPPSRPPKPLKSPKQSRTPVNPGGGDVYSDRGHQYAEDLDEIADQYQTLNIKEIEAAQKRLRDIAEGVKLTTVGKENALLATATAKLQNELADEAKKRNTTIGKIGNFLDRENINAASIITGIFSDSPMVGLMTKAVMESIRHRREKAQKQKAGQLKVGDIRDKLPRPADFHQQQGQGQQGQQPAPQAQPQAPQQQPTQPEQQPRQPAQVHNIGDYESRRPERVPNDILRDQMGNPVAPGPEVGPMKRNRAGEPVPNNNNQDEGAVKLAWYRQSQKAALEREERDWEEKKKQKYPEHLKDPDLFPAPLPGTSGETYEDYGPPSHLQKLRKEEEKRRQEDEQNGPEPVPTPVAPMRTTPARVLEMPQQAPAVLGKAALATREEMADESPETKLHKEVAPERVPGPDNVVTILKGMKKTEEDESKKLDIFSFRNRNNRINPLLELRKLSMSQLAELQKMSKIMQLQLEQAQLANEAAQRETKDKTGGGEGAESLVKNMVKKNAEKEGGMGIMDMILGGFEGLRVVQMLKGGLGAVKGAASKIKGKFSKGAGKAAKGAEEAGEASKVVKGAEEAGEAGKGAKAVEEAGFMGKLLGKVPGLSKVTGAATKFGKLGKGIVGKAGKGLLHNAGYITTALDLGIGYANADSISKRTAGLQQDKNASAGDKFGYKAGTAGAYAVGQALGFIPELLGFNRTSDKITGGMLKAETGLYKAANEGDMTSDIVHAIKSGDKEDKKKAVKKWGTNFPQIDQVIDIGAANWKKPDWPPKTPEIFVDHVLHPEHMKQTPPKPGEKKPDEKKPGEQKPGETKPGEQPPKEGEGHRGKSPTPVPPGTPPGPPPTPPTSPTPAPGAPEPPTPPTPPTAPTKLAGLAVAGVMASTLTAPPEVLAEDVKNDGKGQIADANREKYGKAYSDALDAAVAKKALQGGGTPPGTPPGIAPATGAGLTTPGLLGTGPVPPVTAAEHVTGTTEPTDDTKKIAQVDLASIGKREDALKVYVVNQVGYSRPSAPTTPAPPPAPPAPTPTGGATPAPPANAGTTPPPMPRAPAPTGPAPIGTSLGTGENAPKPPTPGATGASPKPFTPVYTPKRTRELEGKSFAPEKISSDEISTLATKGETGTTAGNPGIVNTKAAAQDAGGYSYGSFQIATKTGTMNKFLDYAKRENPEMYDRLMKAGGPQGALAGSPGFIAEWKALAKDDPKAFHKLQSGFIKETHYDVQMQQLKKAGIDLSGKSNALKNVIFTMATAEGPYSKTIMQALQGKDINKMDDKDLINSIYDTKAAKLDKMYSKNGAGLQAGIKARWGEGGRERKDALAMLDNERNPAMKDATKSFSTALTASADNVNKGAKLTKGDETGAKPTSPAQQPVLTASAIKPKGEVPPIGKTGVVGTEPQPLPTALPQNGKRLATASAQKDELARTLTASAAPSNTNLISAPTTHTNTTNILPGVKAQNTESTYQRTMNANYVAT